MIISRKTHMINRTMSTNTTDSSTGDGFFTNLVLGPTQRAEELKQLKAREKDCETKIVQFKVISSKIHKSVTDIYIQSFQFHVNST